ncbi:MAG: MscS Mechanosensitive ion channel [Gemmatimonadetes bacterium]|jgi:small-conductance mechanosensitive channel|nr:MscS Mechanosensitive ion channel [Gemmatimonadota bacterium]
MGTKLLWSAGLVLVVVILRTIIGALMRRTLRDGPVREETAESRFIVQQAVSLIVLVVMLVGFARIWFNDPGRLATVIGLATAGVAVALQRVITAFAAYLIILRSRIFAIGDRITIGGVRGDVVALGLMQTTVMEMGEPKSAETGDPRVWVSARQYTGRLIRVTNDKIFDTPVYNYTREFPFMWEELAVGIRYGDDRKLAEDILLQAARRHTATLVSDATPAFARLRSRFLIPEVVSLEPHVYLRLTDNWVELSARFIAPVHGVRSLKDAMSREILEGFEAAGLEIASATYEIVGLPVVRMEGR